MTVCPASPWHAGASSMTSLISGFTMATTCVDAQAIHTDTAGLTVAETQIPTGDGALPAYMARPDGAGPFPIILVIEEVFGVHEYIKDVCRRFANQGFMAVAASMTPASATCRRRCRLRRSDAIVSKAPDEQMMADMDAVAGWAAHNHGDGNRLGINGFCRGGRQVWLYAAHSNRLKAAVSWYGVLDGPTSPILPKTALEVIPEVKCPVLGLYGTEDALNPMNLIEEAEKEAKEAKEPVEFVVYPNAPHGFHADYRPSYRAADARTAGTAPWRGFATTGCNVESGLTRRQTDQAIVVTDNTLSSA